MPSARRKNKNNERKGHFGGGRVEEKKGFTPEDVPQNQPRRNREGNAGYNKPPTERSRPNVAYLVQREGHVRLPGESPSRTPFMGLV